jgi:hypothetical protein
MREKLRDRVCLIIFLDCLIISFCFKVSFVTNEELKSMVPVDILPNYLGGNVKLDHKHWLKECNRLITNKTSTCYYYYCVTKPKNENIYTNGHCETIISTSTSNLSTATTVSTNTSASQNRKRPSTDFIDIVENHQKIFLPNDVVNENVKENGHFIDNDDVELFLDE